MQPATADHPGSDRRRRARATARRAGLALVAALALAALAACGGSSGGAATATATSGGNAATAAPATTGAPPPLSTATVPWPAPADVLPRVTAAGLPALGGEQLAYHVHAHLDVIVGGNPQVVPADIGIDLQRQLISPLHTHDASGVIHIEAAQPATFTLGQFFTEWGVRLAPGCVGAYCDGANQPVRFYVDGKPVTSDPREIALTAHEEIAIIVGPQTDVPSSYAFPPGD
jgi:hypothetical protein